MQQIWARLQLLFAHGVATLVGADRVQARVLDNEVLNNLARVEPYGFSYRPQPGAQVYLAFPGGDRSYGVALVIGDKRYQIELQAGEVALHDDIGHVIKLGRDGIAVDGGGHDLTITNAPTVIVNDGDVHVSGGDIVADGISLKQHVHGNVQPGSGDTDLPH
ncbi:phage baseplate assembly protein domain-containing protein [Methylomonas rosea]|uniref:Phage baseplate assembly protein n=1 Tax=Methylomonas rosea TaxID=2952227 RepID=A0ABT1TMU1_9GAMM|nr:phage baseplate assembly protein [Methylomonas sp. WSC-7]MCQ8116095.1 phage baseplate assembly protein [Methylomonas sp. WSC-7]